jgi:hypothetical protein
MIAAKDDSAEHIAELPSLEANDQPRFEVSAAQQITVRSRYPELLMQRPRQKVIYKGPLILFRQAPKFSREMRGAIWCSEDLAFSFSYYGLSIGNGPIGEYLFVLSYSDLFVYWALLTSAKFGVERPTFYLEDVRNFPVAPYDLLPTALRDKCRTLASQIRAGECPWTELEVFVKAVYKISDLDWQLIEDTLAYASPHSQSLKRAAAPVDAGADEVSEFLEEMRVSLTELMDDSLAVRVITMPILDEWLLFEISKTKGTQEKAKEVPLNLSILANQIASVKSFWTTQLRLQVATDQWLVGQPNHARYWTKSKARLLALQLSEAGLFSSTSTK